MAAPTLTTAQEIELQVLEHDLQKIGHAQPGGSTRYGDLKDDCHYPHSDEKDAEAAGAPLPEISVQVLDDLEARSLGATSVRPPSAVTEWFQFSTLTMCMFLAGWNDAMIGPLLDTIQAYYSINYTVVSTIFLAKTFGYVLGSLLSVWLTDRLGFGKILVLGSVLQTLAFAAQAPAPPFVVFAAMQFVVGLGLAMQHAQCNGFVAASHSNAHSKLSLLHALYGFGAVVSPFVATQFVHHPHWAYINIISCALSAAVAVEFATVFKGKRQEEIMPECHSEGVGMIQDEQKKTNKYGQIFKIRAVHCLAVFIVFYTGLEITVGSWIVTYVIQLRNGPQSSGYIASGFYLVGAMLSLKLLRSHAWTRRLGPANAKIGHRRVVYVYCALAAILDLLVWQIRSFLGNAVTVAFMGMFLGPIYPLIMSECAVMIPRHILTGAIGWISGFGQVGSAAFPFATGALASRYGIRVMPPLVLAMVAGMPVLFTLALFDKQRKHLAV
ncbi:MFS general substrate transporter [Auriculariales sp. MPI-PUGE-AT-0066]|nr:MFS general substrate transporter [Auriculariales sp. MPI-PUGE-AT-0066]